MQKKRTTPQSQPPAALFGSFYHKNLGKPDKAAWQGGCWQEPAVPRNCSAEKARDAKNQQLLNFCCTWRLPVKGEVGTGKEGEGKAAGLREGRLLPPSERAAPDEKC